MIGRIRSWWKHLGYSWNAKRGKFTTFGLRPWRGAPFIWLVIDRGCSAVQSKKHVASCEECRGIEPPTARPSEE